MGLVKGIARRVIMVHSPDPRLFDEAIFIVREDAFLGEGVTEEEVLREARAAADGYVRRNSLVGKRLRHLPPLVYAAIGALLSCVCWGIALLLLF